MKLNYLKKQVFTQECIWDENTPAKNEQQYQQLLDEIK